MMECSIRAARGKWSRMDYRRWILALLAFASAMLIVVMMSERYDLLRVTSPSMEPTYCVGDLLVVDVSGVGEPRAGQIVVFQGEHGDLLVKRVVASAGHRVRTDSDRAIVDGESMQEPYVCQRPASAGSEIVHMLAARETILVRTNHVFVMGDNRARSYDSRDFGPVHIDRIRATAIASIGTSLGRSGCRCSKS